MLRFEAQDLLLDLRDLWYPHLKVDFWAIIILNVRQLRSILLFIPTYRQSFHPRDLVTSQMNIQVRTLEMISIPVGGH